MEIRGGGEGNEEGEEKDKRRNPQKGGVRGGTPWPAAGFTNFLKIKLIDSPIFDY